MNKTSRTFFKTMMIGASFCALTALTGCSKGNDENKGSMKNRVGSS